VQLARHPQRPHAQEYIRRLCTNFFELRGDRCFADDRAIIGGIGQTALGAVVMLGHQKGRNTRENLQYNFGMPHPEGFRKAQRLMSHAKKFDMPLICFLDTPGAQPSMAAEERGQAQAIAQSLLDMAGLDVPIIGVVIGEGSSGGALAIGIVDRLLMLEHAIYTVASPEASASILWRDASRAPEAAAMMKITAQDLLAFGIADAIIPEPAGGAHSDRETTIATTIAMILRHLAELSQLDRAELMRSRYRKYRAVGAVDRSQELLLETNGYSKTMMFC
jgi:acetyl-CoA carboxylase carboxyl transferase subunit alpha